uniref:Uncharacterized protein n=1 Tax=Anguilla anguilla TaxID=7936 RepID=A0A0E9XVV7_ANGAN
MCNLLRLTQRKELTVSLGNTVLSLVFGYSRHQTSRVVYIYQIVVFYFAIELDRCVLIL